ncbi:hypothetical protein UY3_11573 [Chelonia mydas]|uniref:Uncharacterized protein n=1 Tax=Chelonia mydas TaxID=8469 RepID=M7B2Q5_CHEMY|nr:hypothetical protein UY3_11573 [Chelonia mydas]
MYETSLRIKALELGDSGVYEARVKIVPATVEDQAFLLAVCDAIQASTVVLTACERVAAKHTSRQLSEGAPAVRLLEDGALQGIQI